MPSIRQGEYASTGFELLGLLLAQMTGCEKWEDYNQMSVLPASLRPDFNRTAFPGASGRWAWSHSHVCSRVRVCACVRARVCVRAYGMVLTAVLALKPCGCMRVALGRAGGFPTRPTVLTELCPHTTTTLVASLQPLLRRLLLRMLLLRMRMRMRMLLRMLLRLLLLLLLLLLL
jgi:hypothetical protein